MTMITPSYLGETIEYSSLHACRSTLEDPTPERPVWSVAFSPGNLLLTAASASGPIQVLDVETGRVRAILTTDGARPMTFSSDGKLLAAGQGSGIVILWDTVSWQERAIFRGHSSGINSLAFSPGGNRLASTSLDGTIKLWPVPRGRVAVSAAEHKR